MAKRPGLQEITHLKKLKSTAQKNILLNTLFSAAACFLVLGLQLLLKPFLGQSAALFYFPAITSVVWYAGSRMALPVIIICTAGTYAIVLSDAPSLPRYVSLGLLLAGGILISYVIDRSRRTDLVSQYRVREKMYADIILTQHQEIVDAQKKIKSRDEFLSIASHELKTPLTSVLLQVQLALHSIRTVSLADFSVENLLKMLQTTEKQTQRLSRMINDLLNVSLITTGRMHLEKDEVRLDMVVKDSVDEFSEKLSQEGVTVDVRVRRKVTGNWDKVRIEQVVNNLLSNAIKYGNGTPISIVVDREGENAVLKVKDGGIGIPSDQQKDIFSLFERGNTKGKYKGLGVGLFITRQIVNAHNGTISLKSKENNGSTFTVSLPLRSGRTEASAVKKI